jgi:hypothetical protein
MAAPSLAVRTAHLQHLETLGVQEAGERGSIGSGALDADALHLPEAPEPPQGASIAGRGRGKGLDAELRPTLVKCGNDVDVSVGVDSARDPAGCFCHRGHRHPFIGSSWVGVAHTCRDGGQDRMGPLSQAPTRSLRPTGACRVNAQARSTDQYQGSKSASRSHWVRPDQSIHSNNPDMSEIDGSGPRTIIPAGCRSPWPGDPARIRPARHHPVPTARQKPSEPVALP